MLKTIIKRSGQTEPYTPSKINNWGEWAAQKLGDRVDWSSVVMDTVKQFGETADSQALQRELINQCLYRKDWPHNLMAGRLYAATLRKELYDEFIPSIKALVRKLEKLGLMKHLDYSDEDFAIAEGIIEHDRDFDMSHMQIQHIRKKYAIQNRNTKQEYETPQFTYMRMALHLAEDEPKSMRMEHVKNFYNHFSFNRVNAPSPNYINLGTNHRGLSSCCLYTTSDTADSLAVGDHIAYKMTVMSAGIGGFINTRAIGDPIRGGAIVHQGKMPYFKAVAGAVTANIQAGRGGACTQYYSAYDPEAQDIAVAQNPRTPTGRQQRDIHFAFQFNRLLLKKINKKEKVFKFTTFSAPDLIDAMFSGDQDHFEQLYEKYENDPTFEKDYVDAEDLIAALLQQSFEVSTHYWANMGEINRHTPHKDKIYSSNLCVAPETPILTKEYGYRDIQTLKDQEVHVWNGKQWSKTIVRKTGENQKLLLVTTSGGAVLEATPYHKWYVQNQDDRGAKSEVIEKRTHELLIGDKLIKYELSVCDHGALEFPFAYENGFFTGDGTNIGYNRRRVYLYNDKQKLFPLFNTDKGLCSYRINGNRLEIEYRKDVLFDKFTIPDVNYTVESRLKWLAGLYDSDGCLTDNQGTKSLQLVSTNFDFLYRLKLALQELGIRSSIIESMDAGLRMMPDHKGGKKQYFCKKTWRILISNFDLVKLIELGFKLNRIDLSEVRAGNRECNRFEKITFVGDKGRYDDTYCFTEELEHKGMFGGVLTGQCLEITQPTTPYEDIVDLYLEEDHGRGEVSLCSLGGIVEPNIHSDEEYESATYYALKMIDKCIHISEYILPHVGFTAKKRLNAAVGILGVAYSLAKKGIKYSSDEGLIEHHKIAERHAYWCIRASLRLGKELGNAPWIHKTKWPQGWLPIDTYKKTLDKVIGFDIPNQYDWEILRQEVIANGGIRNSSLIAIPPTESSSKASGVPNAIYPVRELAMKKSDQSNVLDWVACDSDIYGEHYELAWEIPSKRMITIYGVYQKFMDQAPSADLWKDRSQNPSLSKKEMIEEFLHAGMVGMKTRYYQNIKTSKQQLKKEEDTALAISFVEESITEDNDDSRGCSGGACTL